MENLKKKKFDIALKKFVKKQREIIRYMRRYASPFRLWAGE